MSTTNTPATSADSTTSPSSSPSASATTSESRRRRSIRATRPLVAWRTVDLLVVAFTGVAFGVAYWGWALAYQVPAKGLEAVFPPLQGVTGAPWLIAGVVGGLIVRRPGAALVCELVAAFVEATAGSSWGIGTVVSGVLQGLGAEVAFALLGYGAFGLGAAVLAGALSAPLEAVYEWFAYWTDWAWDYKLLYAGILTASGAVVAGGLGWLLTRGLARAGALNAFPAGQESRESHAV